MKTQHDTKLLESVVGSISEKLAAPARQLNQASARLTTETEAASQAQFATASSLSRRRILIAEGTKLLMIMIAVAIVVLAIGLAARMVISANASAIGQDSGLAVSTNPLPFVPDVDPNEKTVDGGVITTDFSVFRNTSVMLGAREFEVTAGHSFAHEKDQTFENAWCYSDVFVDGLSLDINLGNLKPGSTPEKLFIPPETLSKANISSSDADKLFRNCPWLDGNPNQSTEVVDANTYQFANDVDEHSVDRLIAAIDAGAKVVEFSSPGGLVGEGVRGHQAIKDGQIKTVATGECASACTLLFLGGTEREVVTGGSIAVHQWRSDTGQSYDAEAQLMSAILVGIISTAGVSEDFYVAGATTPADTLYTLSSSELRDWGVVTQ